MRRRSCREGKAPAGSKVIKQRVGLVVLGVLLAASLIVIYRISFEIFWTKQSLQTLKEENEALKRNSSVKPSPVCDEAWEHYGNKCYYFSAFKSSWNNSRMFCREFGADLVKIDSEDEQRFLLNKLKDRMTEHEDKFWIGLTDSKTEGTWMWVDGSPLDKRLQFWWKKCREKQPDNWEGVDPNGEDCARMGELGEVKNLHCWRDKHCGMDQRSICAKAAKGRQ